MRRRRAQPTAGEPLRLRRRLMSRTKPIGAAASATETKQSTAKPPDQGQPSRRWTGTRRRPKTDARHGRIWSWPGERKGRRCEASTSPRRRVGAAARPSRRAATRRRSCPRRARRRPPRPASLVGAAADVLPWPAKIPIAARLRVDALRRLRVAEREAPPCVPSDSAGRLHQCEPSLKSDVRSFATAAGCSGGTTRVHEFTASLWTTWKASATSPFSSAREIASASIRACANA